MRELNGHKVNPANDVLQVTVLDEPGPGGACHSYAITKYDAAKNPANGAFEGPHIRTHILFQCGPINEAGVNGLTHEALLAILIDRLECFQAGPFQNAYNAAALDHLRGAQESLLQRTRDRMARNVEGTNAK